jgi:hypothetical protein
MAATEGADFVSRRDRRPRQRTAQTVVRTHLALITGISNEGRTISVHHEIELVRAAPLDEVVDLRRDLDEPLDRYRHKVSHLRSELRTGPFDEHIEAELDAVWRAEVDPAIAEIRRAMADHGLIREILRSLGGNLSDFVKGGWLPACRADGLLRQHPGPQHRRHHRPRWRVGRCPHRRRGAAQPP